MSEGFILHGLDPEDVGALRTDLSKLEQFRRRLLCIAKSCHVEDEIHLRRPTSRMEARRWNVGTIEYGVVCGRCDRLLHGMRTAPRAGTI